MQLEFRKITPFGHALPPNGHSSRNNLPTRYQIAAKEIISTDDRRTDIKTDRPTDIQTDSTTTIGSLFFKKTEKKQLKTNEFIIDGTMLPIAEK